MCFWVPGSVSHIIPHQPVVCQCLCCIEIFQGGKLEHVSWQFLISTRTLGNRLSQASPKTCHGFQSPISPQEAKTWTAVGLPDLIWFPQSSSSLWSQYFHSRGTPARGITHLVPCLWQWQWCMFPEKLLSSFPSFSSMYHNTCVSIAGQMFFPLSVAILVIQTSRPAGAQHISFLSQHMGSPLGEGLCLARPHCNTHATRECRPGRSDVLWTVPCHFHEPRSNGNWDVSVTSSSEHQRDEQAEKIAQWQGCP